MASCEADPLGLGLDQMKGTIRAIIKQIESLGYTVSVHLVNNMTEIHAVKLSDPSEQHIARSADGNGVEHQYRTVCVLAEMVGIELDDG